MSSISHPEAPDATLRRERAAIAAQACQTCRNRKSKCDEVRPKCGLCRRLGVDCEYREPLPTKKDKTMVHILDALNRLENKFDNLSMTAGGSPDGSTPSMRTRGTASSSMSGTTAKTSQNAIPPSSSENPPTFRQPYQHLTVPHKIILWPGIYIHLLNSGIPAASDLQYVLEEGTHWFIRREMAKHPEPLPSKLGLPCFAINASPHDHGRASNVAFPTLTIQQIQEFSDAYFNTFNVLYPLLNREAFMNGIVSRLLREGYGDGDAGSVLALMVFALGKVAVEGVLHRPASVVNGQPSGFRGGTIEEPPGLEFFNEARRRHGFVMTQCTLENVQINLLQATYYEATARHLDFWRSTVSASMACQVLIRCQPIDWSTAEGDLIKRAYWTCVLSEDLYHLDLDLPQTGIHTMEDEVPMPYLQQVQEQQDDDQMGSSSISGSSTVGSGANEERSHFQYHFLAMIALRRLIARIHNVIHECERAMQSEPLWQGSGSSPNKESDDSTTGTLAHQKLTASTPQAAGESFDDYGGPPVAVIREMVRQLDSWRALLPRPLQWTDNDKFDFPATDPLMRRPNEPLFSVDQGPIPIGHRYNLDVVTAQLRTRFYYARFMTYRPFVYKALHFPELMTSDDCNCCALAIKSVCLWPLAMAPPKNKKRLVPHMFAWTQSFMGILLILRLTTANECLSRIIDETNVVGRQEIESTTEIMLDWMRDVKQVDGIAEWSWGILEPLYGLQPDQ
ncbi:hypothetical protein B0A54_16294 [Friedmanniomyces endolithicus]|uniref:Zn(2)-C6 fungal-type domain-containing protein n=1 Tax=Friedmanniomyces endolithicus TaxID=329885 RepID=A0A4U0U321_9PEZI|nr:hypothetical protein LTS09_009910 [Friedmanniomyces endolithicus]TKA29410.1 hypothetical protein B0A54_16294 [Friedmanniomyces endolithicus]